MRYTSVHPEVANGAQITGRSPQLALAGRNTRAALVIEASCCSRLACDATSSAGSFARAAIASRALHIVRPFVVLPRPSHRPSIRPDQFPPTGSRASVLHSWSKERSGGRSNAQESR